jgi:hypothetical protein
MLLYIIRCYGKNGVKCEQGENMPKTDEEVSEAYTLVATDLVGTMFSYFTPTRGIKNKILDEAEKLVKILGRRVELDGEEGDEEEEEGPDTGDVHYFFKTASQMGDPNCEAAPTWAVTGLRRFNTKNAKPGQNPPKPENQMIDYPLLPIKAEDPLPASDQDLLADIGHKGLAPIEENVNC